MRQLATIIICEDSFLMNESMQLFYYIMFLFPGPAVLGVNLEC